MNYLHEATSYMGGEHNNDSEKGTPEISQTRLTRNIAQLGQMICMIYMICMICMICMI